MRPDVFVIIAPQRQFAVGIKHLSEGDVSGKPDDAIQTSGYISAELSDQPSQASREKRLAACVRAGKVHAVAPISWQIVKSKASGSNFLREITSGSQAAGQCHASNKFGGR